MTQHTPNIDERLFHIAVNGMPLFKAFESQEELVVFLGEVYDQLNAAPETAKELLRVIKLHDEMLVRLGDADRRSFDANARATKLEAQRDTLLTLMQELLSYQSVKQLRQFDNFPIFAKIDAAIASVEKQS